MGCLAVHAPNVSIKSRAVGAQCATHTFHGERPPDHGRARRVDGVADTILSGALVVYRRGPGRPCHVASYSTRSWVGSQSRAASSFTGNSISRQARSENRDVGLWAETCGTATVRQSTRRDILSPARVKAPPSPFPGRGPRTPPTTDRNRTFHGKHALLLADASPHRLRGKHRAASRRPLRRGFHGKPRTLPTASTWIAAESSPASEK